MEHAMLLSYSAMQVRRQNKLGQSKTIHLSSWWHHANHFSLLWTIQIASHTRFQRLPGVIPGYQTILYWLVPRTCYRELRVTLTWMMFKLCKKLCNRSTPLGKEPAKRKRRTFIWCRLIPHLIPMSSASVIKFKNVVIHYWCCLTMICKFNSSILVDCSLISQNIEHAGKHNAANVSL